MKLNWRSGRNAVLSAFALLAAAVSLDFAPAARALPAAETPVYAIDDYPFQKAPALLRWRSVLQREAHLAGRADPDACSQGQPRLACAAKEALLLEEKLQDMAPADQVAAVYAYFNAITYKEHAPECGVDCWKGRLEFLAMREGDCGDHALAEYFTLKRLGFKERDLQLIIAQMPGFEDSFKGGHVVLRVRADGDYYILDNRRNELVGLSGLRKYKVLAGLNADSVQVYNLITDSPPPGFVSDRRILAKLVTSPGAEQLADAAQSFSTQSAATPVASALSEEPAQEEEPAAESETCIQSARLADWNPYLPCAPSGTSTVVAEAKPSPPPAPKPVAVAPKPKPVLVAALPPSKIVIDAISPAPAKAAAVEQEEEQTGCIQSARLSDWNASLPCAPVKKKAKQAKTKPVEKPVIVAKAKDKPAPVADVAPKTAGEDEPDQDEPLACMQGAKLADWNPNLPCTPGGNAYRITVQVKDAL